MTRGSMLVLAPVVLALVGPVSGTVRTVDDPESHIEEFMAWADGHGTSVRMPACSVPELDEDDGETMIVSCYGDGGGLLVAALLTFDYNSGELLDIAAHPISGAPRTRFGDGTYAVGRDIAPGYYVTETAEPECKWTRTPAEGSDFAVQGGDEQQDVEILPTDVSFETRDCGMWELVSDE